MVFTKPIVSPQEARSGQHTTGMGDRLLLSVPLEMQEEERWHMSITSRNANPPTAAQIPKKEDKDTENLFDYLLHLNRNEAHARRLAPYMVMPIDVLGSLAQLRPTTVVHLAASEGVGDPKAKTYGPIFTDAIQWHGTPTDVHSHKQQQQHLEKGAVVAVPPSPPISTTIGCPEIARLERVAAVPTFHTPPHSSIVPQRFSVEEPVQKLCGKRMADELGRNLLRFQTSSSHAPKAKFVRHSGNKIGTTTPGFFPIHPIFAKERCSKRLKAEPLALPLCSQQPVPCTPEPMHLSLLRLFPNSRASEVDAVLQSLQTAHLIHQSKDGRFVFSSPI